MTKLLLALMIAIAAISTPAHGQLNGNGLKNICDGDMDFEQMSCMAYVSGVLATFTSPYIVQLQGGRNLICLPPGGSPQSTQQITDVVKRYLTNNPAIRHERADVLIFNAAFEAFPCRP